jgi:quaternary ammonium compound-resistance protein SugE
MTETKSWIILLVAGLFEVAWAIGLKYTNGFTKLVPSLFTLITLTLSMYLLSLAAKHLPIGSAYGVWVGIGAVGAAIAGIVLFGESAAPSRIFFLIMLVISLIGLKLTA